VSGLGLDRERAPVVIGAGQFTNREDDPAASPSPFDMLETVSRAALSDTGVGGEVLRRLDHVWVVQALSIRHGDPAGELMSRLGVSGSAEGRYSGIGGNIPQWLVNRAADMVVAGERPCVLIAGAEALASLKRWRARGEKPPWPRAEGTPSHWPPAEPDLGVHQEVESVGGLPLPTHTYALIESAIRHAEGQGLAEHAERMGRLMERFNAVAAANPSSWFPARRTAEEIVTPSPENRMICTPYTKYLNAVMDVDMAAAVVVTDAATAASLGVADDAMAWMTGWSDAKEVWYVSSRPSLADSPAVAAACEAAFRQAGVSVDDVTAFDLYSCFPSAVETTLRANGLDVDDPRPLTLTGGLPYHAGPGNNYVTHAVANTLAHVRDREDARVLVHGNGYFLTKHAVGLYQSRPPASVRAADAEVQSRLDGVAAALPVERCAEGEGVVVGYTVPYDRDGVPTAAELVAEIDGVRTVAFADDELTAAAVEGEGVGLRVKVSAGEVAGLARLA
jgi:acetyl-CoA C-acetyltransferase